MKVMLVDDHPLFVDGLRNLLTARGIEVLGSAHDGLEAVDQACKLQPEVILMDIRMPKLDGLAAVRLIKS
ncbi:MAG: response regulator transcription factor [Acidobacteriia bacterium]|nr:response regulator transcription factor [Terriglobia bacterium]